VNALATCATVRTSFPALRFKTLVNFHLISRDQTVGFVGHPDHGHQFFELASVMPLFLAEAVCEAMQYSHWFETETAT